MSDEVGQQTSLIVLVELKHSHAYEILDHHNEK